MVPPLRAILFDYGGVLRGDNREDWAMVDAASGLPAGSLWAAWHDIPEYRLSREGAIDAGVFRVAIHRALIPIAGDAERAEAAMAALEARLAAMPVLDADMRALVDSLRTTRRFKLGLVSNAQRGFTERLRERGVAEFFDDVVVSGDVGVAKPDPAIFHLAARRLGVAPAACLMIDDQPQHLRAAATTGMRTHLFGPRGLAALVGRLAAEGVPA